MKKEFTDAQPTLTEQVIGQLFEYIQTNQLGGGDELPTEVELMDLLKVSRGALREALCHLKALGIVTSRRGSGFRVVDPDLHEVVGSVAKHQIRSGIVGMRTLFSGIRVMEMGCIGDAVLLTTDEDIAAMEEAHRRYAEAARRVQPDYKEIDIAESNFHDAIMAPVKFKTLEAVHHVMVDYFESQTTVRPEATYKREVLEEVILEQKVILDAFRIRSPEAAFFALKDHFRWGEEPEYDQS